MQTIKNQIFSQISNPQVKQFIEQNIFSQKALNKQKNAFVGNFDMKNSFNSSSMFSSYLQVKNSQTSNLSIKGLINKIQKNIVLNGFYKNIEEIKELKKKISQLKMKNQQLQKKICNPTQFQSKLQKNSNSKSFFYSETQQSSFAQINYVQQIKKAQQKLQFSKLKQRLIALVKLSKEDKLKLLQRTKKQFNQMKQHVQILEKAILSTSNIHPQLSERKIEIQELQKQYDQKSMLVQNDARLDIELQMLERKIQKLENTKQQLNLSSLSQSESKQNLDKNQQYSPSKSTQLIQLQINLASLEHFIQSQQNQKQQLLQEINIFNEKYKKQKQKNTLLIKKVKDSFLNSPQLINFIAKLQDQNSKEIQFLII